MKRAGVMNRFGLPLLSKELVEQAARKRTYVLRVVYAALLFVAASLIFYETLRIGSASPFAALGHGHEVFFVVMGLQFAGVYLFMPAITCGVLTQEKERDSLMLLFLTRLGPWTIILEKFVGRLIPMFCFLLLSLPLMAFAYTLGGVTAGALWMGVWMLMLATIQAGSIALFCSAWFRTTVGAFIAGYILAVAMFIVPPVAIAISAWGDVPQSLPILQEIFSLGVYDHYEQMLSPFFVPIQFFGNGASIKPSVVATFVRSVPILLQSLLFLILARVFVVRRAFVPPRNPILAFFKGLDRIFSRLNENRLTRGVVLVADKAALPVREPVAWRETTKRSLGRPQYLFRIFLAIEIPLCLVLLLIVILGGEGGAEGVTMMVLLLWVIVALIVSVQSASLIAGERSHQTLDVLAATPLTGRQILLQKFRGVRRVILVLMIPFVTAFLFATWWRTSVRTQGWRPPGQEFGASLYLTCSALSIFVYLPLVAWVSTLIGLLVRSQPRAIVTAVGTIVGWCVLPLVFIVLPMIILFSPITPHNPIVYLTLLSPATIIPMNELNNLWEFGEMPWLAVILNFVGYGMLLVIGRQFCLTHADRFLGRAESHAD